MHEIPSFIAINSKRNLERATELLEIFRGGVAQKMTRLDLENIVRDMASVEVDHKLLKGLAKVLFDRSEFVEPPGPWASFGRLRAVACRCFVSLWPSKERARRVCRRKPKGP